MTLFIIIQSHQDKPKAVLEISLIIKISEIGDNIFSLEYPHRNFEFRAESSAERKKWKDAIEFFMDKCKEDTKNFAKNEKQEENKSKFLQSIYLFFQYNNFYYYFY